MVKNKKIILASASPRRKLLLNALLKNFGLKFDVIQANIVEYIPEKVRNYGRFAADLAELKALEVAVKNNGVIIAADTIVVFRGRILGKPDSAAEAANMLKTLSGNQHKVYTGLVIFDTEGDKLYKSFEVTSVKFRKIPLREINFYVNTGSPMDKAGAYGIQDDFGSTFVEKISGDYFNVVGLPVFRLYSALTGFIKLIN